MSPVFDQAHLSPSTRITNIARFPARLGLPPGEQQLFDDAAEAVRQEYRSSVRWKRLRCRKVERLPGHEEDTLFILDVGHSIEFDWTWEGAIAFRPGDPSRFTGDIDATDDFTGPLPDGGPGEGRPAEWAGEVVEVDETNGRLFVSVSSPDRPPCRGTFFVRPFEFLTFLHSLFCRPDSASLRKLLPARLNAARGDVSPTASGARSGLKEFERMWGHSWAVLWGPPGCGKTTNIGRQVAACLEGDERILVVSTTNKATDAAALAIGKAALAASPRAVGEGRILRIGKGADHEDYQARGLTGLLRGTETDLLRQIGALTRDLHKAPTHEQRAVLRRQIQELRRLMKDSAFNIFASPDVQVVVATAFKAVMLLSDPAIRSLAAAGEAPFTTVVIDEAGLMARAVVAGLSLLAARRVVVVGDAKQLAPISKMSRVLPTSQATWLASSCLTHLQRVQQAGSAVHLLREQHRMHPQVSRVVSHYQYEGALIDAPSVLDRKTDLPSLLTGPPRAVWYVLDEDGQDLPSIRAERGPGGRSWVRPATRHVLAKLFADPDLRKVRGLFITPFRAQAREVAGFFAAEHLDSWSAGTVHSRQGTEADVVIFDTVNAGSCAWPHDEWKRLVNVGLSRAREFVLVLASQAEMNEPYLRPLVDHLAPRVLKRSGRALIWAEVPTRPVLAVSPQVAANPDLLGNQLVRRKVLRPVMSKEQQRLCGLNVDGKPRLVRGVAGSGKTWVLAHWLHKTVQKLSDRSDARVWAVYANQSLHRLITDTIEEAWRADGGGGRSPLERVQLRHVKHLLQDLFREEGLWWRGDPFDYNSQAAEYLKRRPFEQVKPRCAAMFIDEAQDMGPDTLKLLSALVEATDPTEPKGRAVNIFYDDAQNIYGRPRPTWAEIGLDMIGRSTVMKESFRSTRPITEFALNVLYRLQPPNGDCDHKELVKLGLIEQTVRGGSAWWNVRFNQVEGPKPIFRKFRSLAQQVTALADQVIHWIVEEGVRPCDISILCNDRAFRGHVEEELGPRLGATKARLVSDPGQGEAREENTVVASVTPSFKGYEAEVVVIGGVERFIAQGEILPNNLYVAMTRARSVLAIYAYQQARPKPEATKLLETVEKCLDGLLERPKVEQEISNLDDFEDLLGRLGADNRSWLAGLWKSYMIQQEPIMAKDGEILAEPLFWFQDDDRVFACFGDDDPGAHALHKLEDNGIEVVRPGQELPLPARELQGEEAGRGRSDLFGQPLPSKQRKLF
jgi:superfamily I DNA/RNA helicase